MIFYKLKNKSGKPAKAEIIRLSERYRNMILNHKEAALIKNEDFHNLLIMGKYARLGLSTAIQAAFYLGYLAGKDGAAE